MIFTKAEVNIIFRGLIKHYINRNQKSIITLLYDNDLIIRKLAKVLSRFCIDIFKILQSNPFSTK